MKRVDRIQLNTLSKLLFGTSSKWQKLMKGQTKTMKETLEDGSERKFQGTHYSSLEEIKKQMDDLFKEKVLKEEKQKEEANKVTVTSENKAVGTRFEEVVKEEENDEFIRTN